MKPPIPDNRSVPPLTECIRSAIDRLNPDSDLERAQLLLVVAVGSWADGEWRPGDDIDLRAVYVLPPEHYLGLASYRDELECVRLVDGWELDLVAFEIEKVARLMLKGHRPTLSWLAKDDAAIVSSTIGERLRELARSRLEESSNDTIPPGHLRDTLYHSLDELVRSARLGDGGE